MKVVLQRVSSASVVVDAKCVGEIKHGFLALVGIGQGDTEEDVQFLAKKTVELRVFEDEAGKMNRSLIDVSGELLAVSQFTLFADWRKGRRPGFTKAASPEEGNRLYELYVSKVREHGVSCACGIFGADMKVNLTNDGPVTLILDTHDPKNS